MIKIKTEKDLIDEALDKLENFNIVDPAMLNKVDGGKDFRYSIEVEKCVQKVLCDYLNSLQLRNIKFNLVPGIVSTTFNTKFDFIINRTKFELKISRRKSPLIEYCRVDSNNNFIKESGLMNTKSDYYLFITPNWCKGRNIMKLRIIPTKDLLKYGGMVDTVISSCKTENKNGKPAGFEIDWDDWAQKGFTSDYFIMGFEIENKRNAFNLSAIVPTTNPNYVYENIFPYFK